MAPNETSLTSDAPAATAADTAAADFCDQSRPLLSELRRPFSTPVQWLAMLLWLGGLHIFLLLLAAGLTGLPQGWAVALLVLLGTLAVCPIFDDSQVADAVARFITRCAFDYFPIRVVYEDFDAIDASQAYVLGVEPHSILPIGMVALNSRADQSPLARVRCGATSAVFYVPILRHVWSWLGLAPASRSHLSHLLRQACSTGVIPGGVQECLHLSRGKETIFLKRRFGFVRLALEMRVPLVPIFVFGQTDTYHWWKPSGKWYDNLSRRLGFCPLLFWGRWGTPMPFPVPMTVAVGKPIHFPSDWKDDPNFPSKEQIAQIHSTFVTRMEELVERFKVEAGYPDLSLTIL